jgi:dolichyl-phosphate beta-glucosyltransferase
MVRKASTASTTETLQPVEKVSVILPTYNEQSCIKTTFDAVLEYSRTHPNYYFLFVDDGSIDGTKRFLDLTLNATDTQQIQLLSYGFRGGKGYAVKQGIAHANGDYICYLDSDLAYSLEYLELLVAELQHVDIVIGCRSFDSRNAEGMNLSRKIAGRLFNSASRRLLNLPYRDMQAGLKGFKRDSARALFFKQTMTGFSFDVELIYLAMKYGYSIKEISAVVSDEHQRKSSKVNLLSDSFNMLIDLLEIKVNDRRGKYEYSDLAMVSEDV